MKDFTNPNVGKEYSKFKNMLFIGLFFYALAIAVICWGYFKGDVGTEKEEFGTSLHEIIINNPVAGQRGYIDVVDKLYNFAYYKNDPSEFYFALDKEYIYVIKMNKSKVDEFKEASEENPKRISGITKKVPSDIKKLGIDYYNDGLEADKKLKVSDFDSWFGAVYIDLEAKDTTNEEASATDVAYVIAGLVMIFGFAFTLAGGLAVRRFKKKVEKLEPDERQKIDKEMNDKDAFYYKNAHTYLTKNYIVNFMSTFEAIPYKEVIWVYKYELRQNGIKSQQSVQVMTKDGKTHAIANLTGLTKKANDVFNEILETVAERSTNALIGYTKENREKVKEKIVKPEKKRK